MTRGVQDDFGGFSPRFPGVSVRLKSPAEFDVLDRFMGDKPDSDGGIDAFTAMSIRSVLDHEIRHYHDFLLSPYGSVVYRSKLQAVVAGHMILHMLKAAPGGWLPIPLSTWARLADAERATYSAEWRDSVDGTGIPFDLVEIPIISDTETGLRPGANRIEDDVGTDLATLLKLACLGHSKVRELTGGVIGLADASELQPHNFFEVLGLATQMQAIWNAQTSEAAMMFYGFLATSELPYAKLWQRVVALAEVFGAIEEIGLIDQVGTIACWCVLGNYELDKVKASPNVRFEVLEAHAKAGAPLATMSADAGRTWDLWDNILGATPWRHALQHIRASNAVMLGTYQAAAHHDDFQASLARLFARFIDDQRRFVDIALKEPRDVAHVSRYLGVETGPAGLPLPLCRIDLSGFAMAPARDSSFYPLWDTGFDTPVSQFVLRQPEPDFPQRANDAVVLDRMMRLTELAIDNAEPSLSFEQNSVADLSNWTGKRLLWVV